MYETLSEYETINLTPTLKRRIRERATERGWTIAGTIRYFLEVGLAVDGVPTPEGSGHARVLDL
jgi:hypothetical protein